MQEKLNKEFRVKNLRGHQSEAHKQGLSVLQQLKYDLQQGGGGYGGGPDDPTSTLLRDRSEWKPNAMEQLATKHSLDYENGRVDVS